MFGRTYNIHTFNTIGRDIYILVFGFDIMITCLFLICGILSFQLYNYVNEEH